MSDRSVRDKYFKSQGQFTKDKNELVRFVSLKTNKLSSALYLITNSLSDNEPLKWSLRELSLKILSIITVWANQSGVHVPAVSDDFFKTLEELTTLLNLGQSQTSVSSMNLEVLRNEYLSLAQQLRGQTPLLALAEVFHDPTPSSLPSPSPFSPPSKKEQTQNQKNGDRQVAILRALAGKNWLSIKEIAQALPAVSTKTVQRELNTLLAQEKVKREGERRWSRYLLVAPSS